MNAHRVPIAIVVTACLSVCTAARAQDQFDSAPPSLTVVNGIVTLEREGQAQPPAPSMPYVPGDRLRTDRGRVEVLFPDGSALAVDEFSSVDLQDFGVLHVSAGRILLAVARPNGPAAQARYQIDSPSGSAAIHGPGEYRLVVSSGSSGPQTEFAVLRGAAVLTTPFGSQPLRAGELSIALVSGAPSYPQPFNAARADVFERWASAQRSVRFASATSAQYLPPDLQMYGGTFDSHGSWANEASYGNVWYPSVPIGWRPYYDGYWDPVPRFGWTWIGANLWSWPTHHYGRWGYARSRWFWIPGRQWAPAWVHWGAAPGYVGWCPLGFDNRPVFSLSVSDTNRWADGWVVLPRPYFGVRGNDVHRHAASPRVLPVNTPFVEHAAPPIMPVRAMPRRDVAAISGSRGYAVPRSSTGVNEGSALSAAPPRSTFERRYGVPSTPPVAQAGTFRAPLSRDERASSPRPPSAVLGRSAPVQPSGGGIQRDAPRSERAARASPPSPAPATRGVAVPRSQGSSAPAPSTGRPEGRAQGHADSSRGTGGGGVAAPSPRQHAPDSRRPR